MKNAPEKNLVEVLQSISLKTLLLTCIDFHGVVSSIGNPQVASMTVFGLDLKRACDQSKAGMARLIKDRNIEQVILLAHTGCQLQEQLLTDFDSNARWADLANSLRENRLQLRQEGVSLSDSRQFAFTHAREQFRYLVAFVNDSCANQSIKHPETRCFIADPKLTYRELVKIEINSYRN